MIKTVLIIFTAIILILIILTKVFVWWLDKRCNNDKRPIHIMHPVNTLLLRAGVPKDKLDECKQWAFGDDNYKLQIRMLDNAWNQRHSDLFVVYGADDYNKTIMRIGEAYMNRN